MRLGARPALDEDDSPRVTVGFDRYLAGLAQNWMGVEAASVLSDDPEPLSII